MQRNTFSVSIHHNTVSGVVIQYESMYGTIISAEEIILLHLLFLEFTFSQLEWVIKGRVKSNTRNAVT